MVVLHEKANEGRTLIEKFEHHAGQAGFAVVLLTADDLGRARNEKELRPRGRQNVVFELGFFYGKLGRRRVCVVYEQGVERPSDIDGVVYIPFAGNWKLDLVKELKAAGIGVDLNKLV